MDASENNKRSSSDPSSQSNPLHLDQIENPLSCYYGGEQDNVLLKASQTNVKDEEKLSSILLLLKSNKTSDKVDDLKANEDANQNKLIEQTHESDKNQIQKSHEELISPKIEIVPSESTQSSSQLDKNSSNNNKSPSKINDNSSSVIENEEQVLSQSQSHDQEENDIKSNYSNPISPNTSSNHENEDIKQESSTSTRESINKRVRATTSYNKDTGWIAECHNCGRVGKYRPPSEGRPFQHSNGLGKYCGYFRMNPRIEDNKNPRKKIKITTEPPRRLTVPSQRMMEYLQLNQHQLDMLEKHHQHRMHTPTILQHELQPFHTQFQRQFHYQQQLQHHYQASITHNHIMSSDSNNSQYYDVMQVQVPGSTMSDVHLQDMRMSMPHLPPKILPQPQLQYQRSSNSNVPNHITSSYNNNCPPNILYVVDMNKSEQVQELSTPIEKN